MKAKPKRREAAARGRAESPRAARPKRPAARPARAGPGDQRTLSWEEVSRTHRVRNGVYQRGGRLVSLLTDFGLINPWYADTRDAGDPDTVHYVGAGRRGDQHLTPANRALLDAIQTGHAVPLFNKLAPGRWKHTGLWRVTAALHEYDERERRMLWRFTLKRVMSNE